MTPQNKAFAKFVGLPLFGLLAISCLMNTGSSSSSQPDEPVAKNAAEAAEVGDLVTVLYPASTIMCGERNDMAQVYIVGETMMRQSMRLENRDVWKAIAAKRDGQKHAMASAYSCEWAPKKEVRFEVMQKEIVGDDKSLWHVADYCLKLERGDDDKCYWITETADMNPQIQRVGKAFHQPTYTQQDADKLLELGRKMHQPDSGKL